MTRESMHVQAIVTKYIGPTNFKSGRVKATASAGSITVEWDHSLSINANHAAAAKALANKFNWSGEWYGGGMPNGNGNCYVSADLGGIEAFLTYTKERKTEKSPLLAAPYGSKGK